MIRDCSARLESDPEGERRRSGAYGSDPRLVVLVLLAVATILFSARMHDLSLSSLDDAFYARKGVEMGRGGGFFTVTWNGSPTHHHPPLHFWILGRSFAMFGENDFAARLPSLLMALGSLLLVYRLGNQTVGSAATITGIALLLITPMFVTQARRCTLEVPLLFWVTMTFWVYWEGLRQPRRHLLLAVPLGAAILTKSVLGLLPLLVMGVLLWHPEFRRPLQNPWWWLGTGLGLALGASWLIHQMGTQGSQVLAFHFGNILAHSTRQLSLVDMLIEYPWILLKFYQPLIVPALIGAVVLWRARPRDPGSALLIGWTAVPLVLYSLSSFRQPRFLFPIAPALALGAGWWLSQTFPRVVPLLTQRLVPLVALTVAAVLWIAPDVLTRDRNASFKRHVSMLKAVLPAGETVPYYGQHHWAVRNPLLYYAERYLDSSTRSAADAVREARARPGRVLLCARKQLAEVVALNVGYEIVTEGPDWVLIRFAPA